MEVVLRVSGIDILSAASANMIRYYESIELAPCVLRSRGAYRVQSAAEVQRLRFIHRARELGFSIRDTRRLLGLWENENRTSADVRALALEYVGGAQASACNRVLGSPLARLAATCRGDDQPGCPILDDLSGAPPLPLAGRGRTLFV